MVVVGTMAGLLQATGRDGESRTWLLLTAEFVRTRAPVVADSPLPWVVGSVLVLLVAWMVLVVRTRRSSRSFETPAVRAAATGPVDAGLPRDPVEAMSMLADRHDAGSRSDETESSA